MPIKTIQGVTTSHWSEWPSLKKKSRKNKCWRGVEKREPSYTVDRSVNWSSHYGEKYGGTSKTKSHAVWSHHIIQQCYSWAYINKTVIQKDTCTLLFIAALFTKAKTWKQPKHSLVDEWKRRCGIKNAAIKMNEIMPCVATQIELKMIWLSKVSQKEKGKYCIISPVCGI